MLLLGVREALHQVKSSNMFKKQRGVVRDALRLDHSVEFLALRLDATFTDADINVQGLLLQQTRMYSVEGV